MWIQSVIAVLLFASLSISGCDLDSKTFVNFLRILRKVESAESDIENVANHIRAQGYDDIYFDYVSWSIKGDKGTLPGASTDEVQWMQSVILHGSDGSSEVGVLLIDQDTIAMGHVFAGICAGFNRDISIGINKLLEFMGPSNLGFKESLDNLHVMTLAGDLGQTVLFAEDGAYFGPSGSWDDSSCPKTYTFPGRLTEATDAEILGDIDGMILGIVINQLKDKSSLKLSDFLEAYYGNGIGQGKKYRSSQRYQLFKELVSDKRLAYESQAFAWAYILSRELKRNLKEYGEEMKRNGKEYVENLWDSIKDLASELADDWKNMELKDELTNIWDSATTLKLRMPTSVIRGILESVRSYAPKIEMIPKAVDDLLERIKFPCSSFPNTHHVKYFTEIVQAIEDQNTLEGLLLEMLGVTDYYIEGPTAAIYQSLNVEENQRRGQSFEWYIIGDLINPSLQYDTKREYGVLIDNEGIPLTIGHVLAGIVAGLNRESADFDILYSSTIAGGLLRFGKGLPPRIGIQGTWSGTCPNKYTAGNEVSPTYAQMIGHIDGFVLGYYIHNIVATRSQMHLSELLIGYYQDGISNFVDIRSFNRFKLVLDIITNENRLAAEINEICVYIADDHSEDLGMAENSCLPYSKKAQAVFMEFIRKEQLFECKFGDLMNLSPRGAKYETAKPFKTGVEGSYKNMDSHLQLAEKFKHCFVAAGRKTGIAPALIAAIASRESGVGAFIDDDGYSTFDKKGYGIMQCDSTSTLDCTKFSPVSCEHITMMMEELLVPYMLEVKRKFPAWKPEQWMQGGVAAYNFGTKNVQTWKNLDVGSSHNDFSNDIIARAQRLVTKHGWHHCQGGAKSLPVSKRLPPFLTMSKHYPVYPGFQGDVSRSDSEMLLLVDSTSTETDALRISFMLNRILGNYIDRTVTSGIQVAEDGLLYHDQSAKLKTYLTKRYGDPIESEAADGINGKQGLLFVENVNQLQIGLWDGRKVVGQQDITSNGRKLYLWPVLEDCRSFILDGDCDFYSQCVEKRLKCGSKGYAIGYGHRYCNLFQNYIGEFNDEGKKWVHQVKTCLMENVLNILQNPHLTCTQLINVAMKSHVPCYKDNDFYSAILWGGNLLAMVKVLEFSDFTGPFAKLAWQQVWGLINPLNGKELDADITQFYNTLKEKLESGIAALFPQTDEDDNCLNYATSGNCAFYECFDKKFPCRQVQHDNYVTDFALPSCLEFQLKSVGFSTEGQSWLSDYQTCMMSVLISLYQSSSVNCGSVGLFLKDAHVRCMIEAGFCSMISQNEWFMELSTQDHGYPLILRRRPFTFPLSKSPGEVSTMYYRELQGFKWDMSHARQTCDDIGQDGDLYKIIYSQDTKMKMKIKR